jgi:molybdenum cofactor cytidylyltransferase
MKFGAVSVGEALGATAVHSIRQGGFVLKKGTVIGAAEIAALNAAGISHVVVARMDEGDIGEDEAAARIAAALAGEAVKADRAFTGRCNLFAANAGVLVVDRPAVDAINRVDEAITFATLPAFKPVVAGEMIGTVKIIPFAVSELSLSAALKIADGKPLVRVAPYRSGRSGSSRPCFRGCRKRSSTRR